ncbi:hypothetical protein KY345_01500 [Candidatus Woesearchaeota archaeon]|nr:hypothetical protein [Candidatus Woesearchaeota archaeon]
MRVRIEGENDQRSVKKMMIKPEAILRYLISDDDKMDTLIMCQGEQLNLITTDYYLYEAMGSVKPYDEFKLNKLVKFFQVVEIQSHGRKKNILKEERVEELRKLALKEKNQDAKENDGGRLK